MQDFVFIQFKSQIESIGMQIESVDEAGFIYISKGDLELKISLENARKNYERDKDLTHITNLVDALVDYSTELPDNWDDAKCDVYISLFPNDFDFGDFVHKQITDEFGKVYVHSGPDKFTWITNDDIAKWKVTESDLEMQASNNAGKLWGQARVTFDIIEDRKLGMINTEHETLKGALLFAPKAKEIVSWEFGLPFYAVIPVRDFCYIFSEADFEFFGGRIGGVVVDEYRQSGYPITTEILKFTENGVEAVGKYPVE